MSSSSSSSQKLPRVFECNVCITEYAIPALILKNGVLHPPRVTRKTVRPCECPCCHYIVCTICQVTYGKAECVQCHHTFSRSFSTERIGATFYKTVVVPNITKELMIEQRANLETVDVASTVKWINECASVRKSRRFGVGKYRQMPPRPELTGVTAAKFLCTKPDCRGIVLVNKCSVCQLTYCVHCRELDISNKVHKCDPSAKLVVNSSKPCPKCMFPIYHDGGCPAMLCTHCNTHFDWNTLQIQLTNSSEYKNADVFGILGKKDREGGNYMCDFSNDYPRIPIESLSEHAENTLKRVGECDTVKCPPELFYALYAVTNSCRSFKRKMFDEVALSVVWETKTRDMRVDYLRNKLSESMWAKQVFACFMKYQSHMMHASIVNIYLSSTDDFQVRVRNALIENASSNVYETIIREYEQLVLVCNESFNNIHQDNPISFAPFHIHSIENHINSDDLNCGFFAMENEFDGESVHTLKKSNSSEKCNTPPPSETIQQKPIVLFDYQVAHVAHLQTILTRCHFALDLSMLGAGKTYTAMTIYKKGGYKRGLIIAPASVVQKWRDLALHYGLEGLEVHSFNEMSGSKIGNNTKVGHLIRRCNSDLLGGDSDEAKHAVTSLFRSYVQKGILVIIDEIQNIKNKGTAKTSACKEIICAIKNAYTQTNGSCKSRALLISGSPIDHHKQVEQFFKTVGIMTSNQFTQFNIGAYSRARKASSDVNPSDIGNIEKGLSEIRMFCNQYDQYETNEIRDSDVKRNSIMECYEYFVRIIKPWISSYMVVVGNPHVVHKYNGHYDLTPGMDLSIACNNPQFVLLNKGIRLIKQSICRRSPDDGHTITSIEVLAQMQRGLSMVETAKIPLLVQLVKETAKKKPMCKIVVACNFTSTIDDLVSELSEFSPRVLNGSVPAKHRQQVLKPFQEPNLNSRLLIGNLHVLSSGIDLDDKYGDYPRICFVNPNYHTIDLYQFSYRFLRSTDTKSDSEINLVYVKNSVEQHLISALVKKGTVMKTVTIEQANEANVVFPCDYPEKIAEPPIDHHTWNKECADIYNRIQKDTDLKQALSKEVCLL